MLCEAALIDEAALRGDLACGKSGLLQQPRGSKHSRADEELLRRDAKGRDPDVTPGMARSETAAAPTMIAAITR